MMSAGVSLMFAGGGTGFIGSHLYKRLVTKGYEVTMISRHPADGIITWVSSLDWSSSWTLHG